jgi:cytoskeletal protein RodZ
MKELAEYLKSERTRRGLTLGDISQKARISVDMLEVLEQGDCERIGTALLIRGFIRSYCDALGVDSDPLLEQYSAKILACDQQEESIKRYRKWSKPIQGSRRLGFLALLVLCGSMVGALYGGIWIYNNKIRMAEYTGATMVYPQQEFPPDLPKEARSQPERVKMAAKREVKPEAVVAPAVPVTPPASVAAKAASPDVAPVKEPRVLDAQPPAGNSRELPEDPSAPQNGNRSVVLAGDADHDDSLKAPPKPLVHRFEAEAEQKTWIQVKTDDNKTYSVMMQPGDKQEWETKEGMHVVVGNAGGVRMKWDGDPIGTDGKPGQVLRFRLPDFRFAEKPKPR